MASSASDTDETSGFDFKDPTTVSTSNDNNYSISSSAESAVQSERSRQVGVSFKGLTKALGIKVRCGARWGWGDGARVVVGGGMLWDGGRMNLRIGLGFRVLYRRLVFRVFCVFLVFIAMESGEKKWSLQEKDPRSVRAPSVEARGALCSPILNGFSPSKRDFVNHCSIYVLASSGSPSGIKQTI